MIKQKQNYEICIIIIHNIIRIGDFFRLIGTQSIGIYQLWLRLSVSVPVDDETNNKTPRIVIQISFLKT